MKHSNNLRCYEISFLLCCFLVVGSTRQQYCPPPDIPSGGKYTPKENKFLPGDEVTYTCYGGLTLVGKDRRTCKSNGFWSDKTPFCDRSAKLKNPRLSDMRSAPSIFRVIDNNSSTCFLWDKNAGQTLQLYLDSKVVIHTIKIFLNAGSANIQILTGLDNNMKVCADYDRHIETNQWMQIKCKNHDVLADTMKILNAAGRSTNITICEIQVYIKDEQDCEHPPDIRVSNGYFEVSRNKATLICEEGYKSENERLVCEGNSWKSLGSRCEENLCDPIVNNSTLALKGEWALLDAVRKLSAGTRRQLKCNDGYEISGGPDKVTCQKSGMWTQTNATCTESKSETSHILKNLCDPIVNNSTLALKGEWALLDAVRKLSDGTRRQLKCNDGYEISGGPDKVTCQKSGMWTQTNATCTKSKSETSHILIYAVVGAVVGIIILTLLGITICLVRKQKNREVVVVYRSDGSIAPGSESDYAGPHYETI